MRCALCFVLVGLAACSDDAGSGGGGGTTGPTGGAGGAGGAEEPPVVTELFPAAPPLPGETECKVTITTNLPLEGHSHHEICTDLSYGTNPPSSGDHWGTWAQFRTYATAVPREMYVHNLEHGGIVMAYKCSGLCPDILQAYEDAVDAHGIDPLCTISPVGAERSRFVITPDPELAEPIGLAAWRATYVATCIDPPSILDFVNAHYAKGPENTCSDGKDPEDPVNGITDCP
ncbi:MAG: DUF3105 domain-containing protein [Polyangiaceae bacterium]|nr:DUF3105 domain-containing protein [Polyangiaceae bacterium]